jgi:hypothetical protein
VDRPTATNYLSEEYQDLAIETGWAAGTITAAYNVVLDQSLRQLGYAETDLPTANVDQVNVIAYMALLDYYALYRYAKFFAIRTDVVVQGALSTKGSQTMVAVQHLLDKAEKRLIQLGFGPVQQMQAGRYNLDFLEPGPGEF